MLLPKKVKHRKWHKRAGHRSGPANRGTTIAFGSAGLKALSAGRLSSRQIEAARRAITRHVKRGGKIWIRVFPNKPITQKGSEVGMGGGKGAVDHFVMFVRPGRILFEIDGVADELAQRALALGAYKLPLKTKIVRKGEL